MSEVVYRSQVRIERKGGPVRHAWVPGETEPLAFGIHGPLAERYGIDMATVEPHGTTLDYLIATTGGCLTGTFMTLLEAAGIDAGALASDVEGEVEEEEGGLLSLRRIRVRYELAVPPDRREEVRRIHDGHQHFCPVHRALSGAVDVTTHLDLVEG